jgi:predicted kinase
MDLLPNVRNRRRRLEAMLEEALQGERSVVLDNTNPTPQDRAVFLQMARAHGATTIGYYFESRLADCLERNSRREGIARVPAVALHMTRNKLVMPGYEEGFDQLFFVKIVPGRREVPEFNVMEWQLSEDGHEQS